MWAIGGDCGNSNWEIEIPIPIFIPNPELRLLHFVAKINLQMQMNSGRALSWPQDLQSRPHMCLSIVPFNLIACSPQAIAGEIGMDNVLDNIANSLFNGLLPAAWSKLAPATCKQLASWLEHLRVSREGSSGVLRTSPFHSRAAH